MYRGILGHGNALGETAATFCVGLLILINAHMFEQHRKVRAVVLLGVMFIFGIGLVLLSSSRTSLVSLALIMAIVFFHHVRFEVANLCIKIPRLFVLLLIFVVLLIMLLIMLKPGMVSFAIDAMINKFIYKSSQGDITSNRIQFWVFVLSTVRFFGHGTEYLQNMGYQSAHSDIFQATAESGVFAALSMIAFMVVSLWHSFWYALKHRSEPFGLAPFLIILYFWLMVSINNLFGSLGVGITMAMFLAVGTLLVGYEQR
jgi:O-antigen ligase